LSCNGAGGVPPVTLAEITLNGAGGLDFYDVSLVDGFNVPAQVRKDLGQSTTNIKFLCYEFTLSFLKLILYKQDGRSMLCSSEYGDEHSDCIAFREFVHSLTISSILRKNSLPNGLFRDVIKLHSSLHCATWLTNSNTVLPEKITDRQLVKKLPIFYGIGTFIFVFARAQYLSLS
jgi:hypothetical protein